jgi:hypothetical protein
MKTFREFEEGLTKSGYEFIRRAKKPFGYRAIGHKKMGIRTDNRILMYIHTRKEPAPRDFIAFLKDFQKFIKANDNFDVKAGLFIVDKSCGKRLLQGFRTVLRTADEDIRKKVKIIQVRM